jgi:regulator of sigma E protease
MILWFVYGFIGLSLVVFVHELGHFVAARACGIEVVRFSIGMGKRLFGFSRKGTDYCVSMFPIGGYCKMKGENALLDALDSGGPIAKEPGSFYAAHPLKRVLVSFMGPFFNVLFAVVALSIVAFIGYAVNTTPARILLASEYPEANQASSKNAIYPADSAGLKSGDRILSIDGEAATSFDSLVKKINQNPNKKMTLEVERDGKTFNLTLTTFLDREKGVGRIGVISWIDPIVNEVKKKGPAEAAGVMIGDIVESIDGKPVRASYDLTYALESRPQSITLGLLRSGSRVEATLRPAYSGIGDDARADIGIVFPSIKEIVPPLGFFPGVAKGVQDTAEKIRLTIKGIGLLVYVNLSKALAGPLRMTYLLGEAAQSGFSEGIGTGFVSVLELMSIISIGLFITNLLPLPILDGGMIVMFIIELFRKKTFKPQTIYRITMVGLVLLVGIFLFTTFNDIIFFAKG